MLKKVLVISFIIAVLALVVCLYVNVNALPKQFVMPKGPAVAPTLKPDLVITSVSVQPSRILFGGDGGVISFTVKNQGTMAAGNFYCGIVGRGADTEKKLIAGLGIGEEKSDTFIVGRSGQRSSSPGSYDQYVNIDPDSQIVELNKNNNLSAAAHFEVYQPVIGPDLTVIQGAIPQIHLGEPVTFEVKNIGNAPTPGNNIMCQVQGRSDIIINRSLASGEGIVCSIEGSGRMGINNVRVTVNYDRQFAESEGQSNNSYLIGYEIIPSPQLEVAAASNINTSPPATQAKPDLVVENIRVHEYPYRLDLIKFNYSVRNKGTAPARGTIKCHFQASNNPLQWDQSIRIDLQPGEKIDLEANKHATTVELGGRGYSSEHPLELNMNITADSEQAIVESNENNRSQPFTIYIFWPESGH